MRTGVESGQCSTCFETAPAEEPSISFSICATRSGGAQRRRGQEIVGDCGRLWEVVVERGRAWESVGERVRDLHRVQLLLEPCKLVAQTARLLLRLLEVGDQLLERLLSESEGL